LAVRKVLNQLIRSGVYEVKIPMDSSAFASMVVSEYEDMSASSKTSQPLSEVKES